MKIGVLAPYSRPWDSVEAEGSGQNVLIRESVMALSKQVEVSLFRRKSRDTDASESQLGKVTEVCVSAGPAERLGRRESFESCVGSFPYSDVKSFDAWIAHYWVSAAWIRQIRSISDAPILYFSHSFYGNPLRISKHDLMHEKAERYVAEVCTWAANSSKEKEDVLRLMPEADVVVIPPGHTIVEYEGKSNSLKRFLFAGRKNEAKGFDIFVDLAREFPDYQFRAIGREESSVSTTQNLVSLPILTLEGLGCEISRSDLVFCPSRYEHFGLTPLLSGYCETAVIASAVGGHLDTVFDGKTGFLCEPTLQSFGDAVSQVIEGDYSLINMGKEAHNFVTERFSWDLFVNRCISLLTTQRR